MWLSVQSPIFRNLRGRLLNASSIRQMFNRLAVKSGIPDSRFQIEGERSMLFSSFRDMSATRISNWAEQGHFVNNVKNQF